MVANSDEVLQLRQALDEAETELHAQEIEHAAEYQVGIMVEVPSAVFGLCTLLKYVDYVSIGSNDLFQYTFAVDRGNEKVSAAFQFLHPVFLAVIAQVARTVRAVPGKGLAICGEMAGNPMAVPLLVGAGIEDLSMAIKQIPAVKKVLRAFSRDECRILLGEALRVETPEAVADIVRHALAERGIQF
jgi:phosphoenolpyruvate-protein kinase (PTS system EI component)